MQFKTVNKNFIKNALLEVGLDKSYVDFGVKKHKFLSVKICGLSPVQATIIKQTALAKGADAAVHRGVLTHEIEKSDLILSGSFAQLENIANALKKQPFGLTEAASRINCELSRQEAPYCPSIMGILNVTENSFSDGGKYLEPESAIKHGIEMVDFGAKIIDIGAESTKPGAKAIPPDIEIKRLTPVVIELVKTGAEISIDTRNSKTARAMLELGVNIINDVSGLDFDPKMADTVLEFGAKLVIMHSRGIPETMDGLNEYKNLKDEIFNELARKIEKFAAPEKTIIDVGFGFAKDNEQNFELLRGIEEFNSMGVKTLAGVSRKRFLRTLCPEDKTSLETGKENFEEADLLTALSSFYLFQNRIDIVRVHDVRKTKLALDFYKKLFF